MFVCNEKKSLARVWGGDGDPGYSQRWPSHRTTSVRRGTGSDSKHPRYIGESYKKARRVLPAGAHDDPVASVFKLSDHLPVTVQVMV